MFLHRTDTVMDCSNDTATVAMGVFFGCIKGKSAVTGKTLVHKGMVYLIEVDIIRLSCLTRLTGLTHLKLLTLPIASELQPRVSYLII